MLNELAQWGVLLFLAIFVFGLTRQLGLYIVPRQQQLEDWGPPLKKSLPSKLLGGADRTRLVELMRDSPAEWAAVLVVDEVCPSCTDMLETIAREGRPEAAPLVAITNTTGSEFLDELRMAVDIIIIDPKSERCHGEGIYVTPFVMILDDRLRVVHKQVGGLADALEYWRKAVSEDIDMPTDSDTDGNRDESGELVAAGGDYANQ